MYLTIDEILLTSPRLLEDDILIEMNNADAPLQPIPEIDLDEFENLDLCERWNEWRANRRDNMRNVSPSRKMHKIKRDISKARLKRKMISDKAISSIKDIFINMWNELKGYAIKLWEDAKLYYYAVINYFKSNFQKLCMTWKKLKRATSDEEKAARKAEIKNYFKTLGNNVAEMFGIYVIVDYAKSLWNVLKNVWSLSKSKWQSTIAMFRDTESILNECPEIKNSKRTGTFVNILTIITPLLAQLGTVILALLDCYKAEQMSCESFTADMLSNIDIKRTSNHIDISDVIKYINGDFNNIDNTDDNSRDNVTSICYAPNNNVSDEFIFDNGGYIISIDNDIQKYSFSIKPNQHINYGDIIGYIDNSVINSEIAGTVVYVKDRNALIYNDDYNNDIDIESEIANMNNIISDEQTNATSDNNEIMRIGNAIKEMNDIEEIIRQNYNLFAAIILNGNAVYDNSYNKSFKNFVDDIQAENAKIIKKYEDGIMDICSSTNVKMMAEKNNLDEIKTNVQNIKYEFVDNAFKRLTNKNGTINVQNYYTSNINAYNLCDTLLPFFNMNVSDNKLMLELDGIITNMFINRFNREKHNINNLIDRLNDLLNDNEIDYTYAKLYSNISTHSENDALKFFYKIFNVNDYAMQEMNAENISEDEQQQIISDAQKEMKISNDRKNLAYYAYKIFKLIVEIKKSNITNNNTNKSLKLISTDETNVIIKFITDICTKHKHNRSVIDDIENLFDRVGWPNPSYIQINNGEYQHYIFTKNDATENDELIDDDILTSHTKYQLSNLKYWLKYCTMATLVNCSMPLYWSTGFVAAGAPILFPIILIPIKYIPGKIGTLIGLGICGVMVYPMIIMMNMTIESHTCLIPINNIIDRLRDMLKNAEKLQIKRISKSLASDIDIINNKINNIDQEIEKIKNEILLVKSM